MALLGLCSPWSSVPTLSVASGTAACRFTLLNSPVVFAVFSKVPSSNCYMLVMSLLLLSPPLVLPLPALLPNRCGYGAVITQSWWWVLFPSLTSSTRWRSISWSTGVGIACGHSLYTCWYPAVMLASSFFAFSLSSKQEIRLQGPCVPLQSGSHSKSQWYNGHSGFHLWLFGFLWWG